VEGVESDARSVLNFVVAGVGFAGFDVPRWRPDPEDVITTFMGT
jgi:hypothetical protein